MTLEPVDFGGFNRPPYFPEWLRSDETLALAEFDDGLKAALDAEIGRLAKQFDIEGAGGVLLDRLGKLLDEDRNGSTDAVYRQYLRLRTMLNTANGTVEDIIKFVKFFYSSETVHIVPNYPAGIRILHDGENDAINFNSIVRQMVGAGIAYDTRELFNVGDDFPVGDADSKRVRRSAADYFSRNAVRRNGRVLRDGRTVLDGQDADSRRNGKIFRNGEVTRNAVRRVRATGDIATPVLRNSGPLDFLALEHTRHFSDVWRFAGDLPSPEKARQNLADGFPIEDGDVKAVGLRMSDGMGIADAFSSDGGLAPQTDSFTARIKRNGAVRRDGLEKHGGWSARTILEQTTVGIRHRYFRDGSRLRNGAVERKGDIFLAMD